MRIATKGFADSVPPEVVVAFAADQARQAAFEISPQGRYVAAMEIARALGLEVASVASAAADTARLEWERGLSIPSSLASDVARTAARIVTAASIAVVVSTPVPHV